MLFNGDSMVVCPECGKDVKEAKFCSNCGAHLPERPEGEVIETEIVKNTKFCPNCGTELDSSVVVCPECGTRLIQEETRQTKFCQNCGKKIDVNAVVCPYCGVGTVAKAEKSVFLAALLSIIFPGLGQLYNGQTHKGIFFIILYLVSAALIVLFIGFVLVFIVWVWSLIDVIKSTEAINRGEYVEDKLL